MPDIKIHGDALRVPDFVYYFHKDVSLYPSGTKVTAYHGNNPIENFDALEQCAERKAAPGNAAASVRSMNVSIGGIDQAWEGRGLACRCCGGSAWSVTIRHKPSKATADFNPRDAALAISAGGDSTTGVSGFAGDTDRCPSSDADFLFSINDFSELIYKLVEPDEQTDLQGLILITGETGAAKSQTARALLYEYLIPRINALSTPASGEISNQRRPHLIILEKPIESRFFKDDLLRESPPRQQEYGIDVTARLLDVDTESVQEGLEDALRQKPAAVLLDEVRNKSDWPHVLRFAASGHLIVTTAHAGSLTEAMSWILQSAKATTPAQRGAVASRIRCLVHLAGIDIRWEQKKGWLSCAVPSLWRGTPAGISALVADGLASLVPANPSTSETDDRPVDQIAECALGRRWFANRLLNVRLNDLEQIGVSAAELRREALERDLEGK